MSIYRVAKDASNPYVIVNKVFINDEKLSLKAKGLMSYFLSKPDAWEFYIEEIKKHTKDKEAAITSAIKELLETGYIKRTRKRKDGKFIGGYIYDVFEMPDYGVSIPRDKIGQALSIGGGQAAKIEGEEVIKRKGGQATQIKYAEVTERKRGQTATRKGEETIQRKYEEVLEKNNGEAAEVFQYQIEEEIEMLKHHTGENTESGKSHTGKNTDMGSYRYGETPIWGKPVLLNNDFNNNNDFNSNNEIYTSDFKESDELSLAKYLFKHIKKNNPKAKEPSLDKWSKIFKLILKKDQREPEEVKRIIKFSQEHDFWYKNILSPEALRKQYDRLFLEINDVKHLKKKQENYAGTFGDYKQRTYDFDKLERRLLGWDKLVAIEN